MFLSTDKFIRLVKQRPVLYDTKHEEYKDSKARDRAWKEIASETNEDGKSTL